MRNAETTMRNGRRGLAPAVRVGAASRHGAVLLEVIVSLGLLVAGMAMVGFQINTALVTANAANIRTRAMMLVDAKMSELDAGVLLPTWIGDELQGYFGIEYPGYSWRMRIKPAEIQNLYLVMLDIGFNESRVQEQIANPETEIKIEDPGTQILRTVYRLVPKPADVNLQRDFGLTQEELDELTNAAAGADPNAMADAEGGGGMGGGPAGGGGPGGGANGDMMAMLSKLVQAISSSGLDLNNINPRDLAQFLDADTLEALGPMIDMYFGNGLDPGMLPGAMDNPMIRNLLNGGGRGGRDRGGRDRGGDRNDSRNADRDGNRDGNDSRNSDQNDNRDQNDSRNTNRDNNRDRNDDRNTNRDNNRDRNDNRNTNRDNQDNSDSRNNTNGNRLNNRRNPPRNTPNSGNFGGGNPGGNSGGASGGGTLRR